jgi:iron complex transport system substrate-binding protein
VTPPEPSAEPASPTASNYPITIVDDAGRSVIIDAKPEAIISLAPSNTEILYALGLGDSVVGVTEFCNYPAEALEKPKVGGFSDANVEVITALEPDLILAANLHIAEGLPALEKLGLTVVVIDPLTVPSVLEGIKLVGQITDQEDATETLLNDLETRIADVTTAIEGREKPRTFWEISGDLWTSGPGSFIDDLIQRAGGVNIVADADSPWIQITTETLIAADPEVVFLSDHAFGETKEMVVARPGWAEVSAVINDRIIEIDDPDIFSRPGPRVIEALELVAKALHPDAFD